MARDEWRFNYMGLFLSVSGIIVVLICGLIAYNALDFTGDKLDGETVASTLPSTIDGTVAPPPTTLADTTTTTTTVVAPAVDQAFLTAVNELLAASGTKLAAYESARTVDPYGITTTKVLAGELAVLWNSAPPQALGDVPWGPQYNAARSQVGNLFLAVYDLIQQPRDFSDIDDAQAQVETVAIPLIQSLQAAIGP